MEASTIVTAVHREVADERAAASLEAAAHVWLLDLAAQAAAQLNAQLPAGHVEVRLSGRDPELVYVADAEPEPVPAADDNDARITLRLPESLKANVERWAAEDGVSVNTWLVRTIARGNSSRSRAGGRRLTGYGRG